MTTLAPIASNELKRLVPAVFSKEPVKKASDKYQFIDSAALLKEMTKAGFVPVEARQYTRRDKKLLPFTRHMIKFRPAGELKALAKVGDVVPQIIYINSHDLSTAFSLSAGLYKLACENGLVVSAGFDANVRVKHFGGHVEEVVHEALKIAKRFNEVRDIVAAMMKVTLTQKEQAAFAKRCLKVKEESQNPRALHIEPDVLLAVRRDADKGNDLWRVMNRVQENIIKGGVLAKGKDGRERLTRPVTSLVTDLRINRGIWEEAAKLAA